MTIVPELSALIIQHNHNQQKGYTNSSLLFLGGALIGLAGCTYLLFKKKPILTQVGLDKENMNKGIEITDGGSCDHSARETV
jgi:hypothetical protein